MRFAFDQRLLEGELSTCRDEPSPLALRTATGTDVALQTSVHVRYDAGVDRGSSIRFFASAANPGRMEFLLDDVPLTLTALAGDMVTVCSLVEP